MKSLIILGVLFLVFPPAMGEPVSRNGTVTTGASRLSCRPDESSRFAFSVMDSPAEDIPISLVISSVVPETSIHDSTGIPADTEAPSVVETISLVDSKGRPASAPRAICAVHDSQRDSIYRIFVLFAGSPERSDERCIVETIFDSAAIGTKGPITKKGRVFKVPVLGSIEKGSMNISSDGKTLNVNLQLAFDGALQPCFLSYNIEAASTNVDPKSILMPSAP